MRSKGSSLPKPRPGSIMLSARASKPFTQNKIKQKNNESAFYADKNLCPLLANNVGASSSSQSNLLSQSVQLSALDHLAIPMVMTQTEYKAMALQRYRSKRKIRIARIVPSRKPPPPRVSAARKKKPRGTARLACIPTSYEVLDSVPNCKHCSAVKFKHETQNMCCSDGDVTLAQSPIPVELRNLLLHSDYREPRGFRVMIRAYNNHLAFTSLGLRYDKRLAKRDKGIYAFRVQGQVYHWINDLQPLEGMRKNLQLYYHDTDYEIQNRLAEDPSLDENILRVLIDALKDNPYAKFFRSLSSVPDLENKQIILKHNPPVNHKTYSQPTVSQVAVLLDVDETNNEVTHRDIKVYTHSGQSRTIHYHYGCFDSLQYPVILAGGDPGWQPGIPKNGVKEKRKRVSPLVANRQRLSHQSYATADEMLEAEEIAASEAGTNYGCVSMREFYSYKFQIRENDLSHILRFGRLFQQYSVDMYIKLETQRLDFYRAKAKQDEIRQEFLQGIVDAVGSGEHDPSNIGHRIVLPGSFIGGPRYMRRKYVDAMTLVQKFGKPDIFLTMTCNPNWPEIKQHLLPVEQAQDRPDLTARVFHAKVEELKVELIKNELFGEVAAYTYVIEYQKRGLPHAHFLLILKNSAKFYDPKEYDRYVSAELPDKELDPWLYECVVRHMIHGPCGELNPTNVCMQKDKTCKNSYPKQFCDETTANKSAYPTYRRRNDGKKVKVRGSYVDNRWVVPHTPYLVAKFDCHINVEICASIEAVKYIYKYICKGSDRILFQLSNETGQGDVVDEIDQFVSARWISPPEAMWRIFRFPMSEMKPPIICLPLHLENYQAIRYKNTDSLSSILENSQQLKTMLTEFFHTNKTNKCAQELNCTYVEFPTHFVWNTTRKQWTRRKQGQSIGRIVTAHPTEGERFYLRILLTNVRCPVSYESLRTFDNKVVPTFREAALLRGLLEDDNSQELCMQEASLYRMPFQLRQLFSTLLVYCSPNNPEKLFLDFEDEMSEDINRDTNLSRTKIRCTVIHQIDSCLKSMGKNAETYLGALMNDIEQIPEDLTSELRAESNIVVIPSELNLKNMLNPAQKEIFRVVTDAIYSNKGKAYFVDGPGGTGKTFLYRSLLAETRSKGFYALATATSGIAASILPGGRTAHSRFKIPIDDTDFMSCKVSKQSALGTLLRESKLIIWDEAPMAKRSALEALNELLQDIMSSSELFGGKVVVFGGDFRQTLPVVQRGTKKQELAACVINSPIWPQIEKLYLTENMRARTDPYFASFLMLVGEGKNSIGDVSYIDLPSSCVIPATSDENKDLVNLITAIYPDIGNTNSTTTYVNRAILTTKNQFVDEINSMMIERFVGDEVEYTSFDQTENPDLQGQYHDLINSITPNGLPPHRLILKIGAPIILLRNLNPSEGLCNGTRLICKKFSRNVIQAEIALGDFTGQQVFLHRIPLRPPSNETYPVPYKRTQFPIRLCFAMTINKSQGQTLDSVGVYIKEPVFSHGQLYVALSRAKNMASLKILLRKDSSENTDNLKTKNIVYREVMAQ